MSKPTFTTGSTPRQPDLVGVIYTGEGYASRAWEWAQLRCLDCGLEWYTMHFTWKIKCPKCVPLASNPPFWVTGFDDGRFLLPAAKMYFPQNDSSSWLAVIFLEELITGKAAF